MLDSHIMKHNETDLRYNDDYKNRIEMCDLIDYELKDRLRMKKTVEEQELEELELEKVEEQPITISKIIKKSWNQIKPNKGLNSFFLSVFILINKPPLGA